MPIYDFRCAKCKHKWDQFCEVDGRVEACPRCGDAGVEKLPSLPSPPIFHGRGFHETDYGRKPR